MTDDVQVRHGTLNDAAAIARVHAKLFEPAWDRDSVTSLMGNRAALVLVAENARDQEIAGFVLAHIAADEAEVLSIGVAPGWQRRGIARQLMRALHRLALENGAARLFLEVAEDNQAAQQLYATLGFTEVGRRSRYYERPGRTAVDAVVMARTVTA